MYLSPINESHFAWPAPGTVVSVPIILGYRHKGIVSDRWHNGRPMVISNSNRGGGVVEESWDSFCQGRAPAVEGYPGNLPCYQVLSRARLCVGKGYRLLDWNCEHFVMYAHGLKPESWQVLVTFATAAIALALATAAR